MTSSTRDKDPRASTALVEVEEVGMEESRTPLMDVNSPELLPIWPDLFPDTFYTGIDKQADVDEGIASLSE